MKREAIVDIFFQMKKKNRQENQKKPCTYDKMREREREKKAQQSKPQLIK